MTELFKKLKPFLPVVWAVLVGAFALGGLQAVTSSRLDQAEAQASAAQKEVRHVKSDVEKRFDSVDDSISRVGDRVDQVYTYLLAHPTQPRRPKSDDTVMKDLAPKDPPPT